MHLNAVLNELQTLAPLDLAESWDNVGLLVGDRNQPIGSVMTCLTVSETTLQEAIEEGASLIVAHHPIPFKPIHRLNSDTVTGRLLLAAIQARIAIYSAHTAWDNSRGGINEQLGAFLELENLAAMQAFANAPDLFPSVGVGRYGRCGRHATVGSLIERLHQHLPEIQVRCTHGRERAISKLGIVCGSGGSMLGLVASRGCDAMLTGEATYHQCLEAEQRDIVMLMIGHHASEAFAMRTLAETLQKKVPKCRVFASQRESSPF
jgi:dinuclear metal center YbgI/SA1388 family protein